MQKYDSETARLFILITTYPFQIWISQLLDLYKWQLYNRSSNHEANMPFVNIEI